VLFHDLAQAAVDDLLRLDPEQATYLGDHRFDERVTDRSDDGQRAARAVVARHRAELDRVDPAELDREDRVDLAMLTAALDRMLFEVDEVAEHRWNPLVHGPGEALYPLLTRDVLPVPDRLRAIAARLEATPELLLVARRELDDPPRVHVETALLQHPGVVTMVGDEVSALLEQEPRMAPLVEPAQHQALAALEEHQEFLAGLLERASGDFRLGAPRFHRRLQLVLASPMSPDEVLARARAHLEEVTELMYAVALDHLGGAAAGSREDVIRAALDDVARVHPDDTTVVEHARSTFEDCVAETRRLGLVSIPDDPVRVEVMPEFRRGVAVAYCDPPGPFEDGGVTSYAISPTPQDWPPERVESFYREYNSAAMVDLSLHEGVPGHVLQLAHSRRFRGSTPVRKLLSNGPFIEGWAVHAERLLAESGFGGRPVRLSQLKMQLRMTINAILDAGVHAQGMTEAEAMELMTGHGFQEEGEAVGKWRRACLTSAQLSTYFVGYSELDDLLSDTGPRQGYDEVLAHGSPPATLLRDLLGG
jgi:uncharacterized protein (DUF885 family)